MAANPVSLSSDFRKLKKKAVQTLRNILPDAPDVYNGNYSWQISPEKGFYLFNKQKAIESPEARSRKVAQHPDTKLVASEPDSPRMRKIAAGIQQDVDSQTAKAKAIAHNKMYRKKKRLSGFDFIGGI